MKVRLYRKASCKFCLYTFVTVAFKNSLSLPYFKLNVNFADALILFFLNFYRSRNAVNIVNSIGHNNRIGKISYHNSPIKSFCSSL